MKKKIKKVFERFKNKAVLFASKHLILTKIYYFFFDSSFNRELFSVLNGKKKYYLETRTENKSNKFLLIRNVHKLEKGLSMRQRRSVFGLDFIEETVLTFKYLIERGEPGIDDQLIWARDVLDQYFRSSGDNALINKLKPIFYSLFINELEDRELFSIPYAREVGIKSKVSYEEFYELTKQRRSVRWYKDQKVDLSLVDKAVLAALQSPSACNRQPFEFRVIQDEELLRKISSLPMGTSGYAGNIPLMIAMIGNLDAYFDERDRHVIYIDASLASMSFMLALETLGLSSCAINWPDIEKRERHMSQLLKLKKHQRVTMLMSVGYADDKGMIPFSCKKSLESSRIII